MYFASGLIYIKGEGFGSCVPPFRVPGLEFQVQPIRWVSGLTKEMGLEFQVQPIRWVSGLTKEMDLAS